VLQEHAAMNQSSQPVVDIEAATDQLVDEICQRLAALYGLVQTSLTETGPPITDIRAQAVELTHRLNGPKAKGLAAVIARALWPPRAGTQVPRAWWATPLGRLLSNADSAPSAGVTAPPSLARSAAAP
jgi:hypothetical protein